MTASNALMKVGVDKRQKFFSTILEKSAATKYIIAAAPPGPRYIKEFRAMGIDLMQGYGITGVVPPSSRSTLPSAASGPPMTAWAGPSPASKSKSTTPTAPAGARF